MGVVSEWVFEFQESQETVWGQKDRRGSVSSMGPRCLQDLIVEDYRYSSV